MSVPVRRRRQAEDELLGYVDAIAEDNVDAAIRLIDAFEDACRLFAEHPEIAPFYETDNPALEAKGIRRWVLRGFSNYLVFYVFTATPFTSCTCSTPSSTTTGA